MPAKCEICGAEIEDGQERKCSECGKIVCPNCYAIFDKTQGEEIVVCYPCIEETTKLQAIQDTH